MKRFFGVTAYVSLLICLLLCACTKTAEEYASGEANSTGSYLNISFGTRSNFPSVDENKESGIERLRIMIFDAADNLEFDSLYTSTNAGRVPDPVIKVMGGQRKTIYAIANEHGQTTPDGGRLADILSNVKTKAEIERTVVKMTVHNSVTLPASGLLMVDSTVVDAKFGSSMLNPQKVALGMERLTSKIILNAHHEAGMTVKIIKIKAKNLRNREFLIATAPDYDYPPGGETPDSDLWLGGKSDVPEISGTSFPEFARYYLGTNYAGQAALFSMDITYEQTVGTDILTTKTTTILISSAVERNVEYIFNLNFLLSTVKVNLSVKNWDDQEISGDVVEKAFLSLSQSELTMYGSHNSTIYLETDGNIVQVEDSTQGGEHIRKYFTNLPGGITVRPDGSGKIVLTPIPAAMSPTAGGQKEIGLYFKSGNIRKLVKVTHINKEAYAVKLDANGGNFGTSTITTKDDGPVAIGSGYTIKDAGYKPVRTDHSFLGWALSQTALLKDFSVGDNVSYEALERPKELLTLYAVWGSESKSTLVFDPNGKSAFDMPNASTGNPGDVVDIPSTSPRVVGGGYIFVGWNTKADGLGKPYALNSTFVLEAELSVLYAIWKVRPVKITLWRNYKPDATVAEYIEAPDSKFTITVADPSLKDHYFRGWNTLRDGSGTYYAKNTPHPLLSTDLPLFAIWGKLLTVTFINQGDKQRAPITGLKAGDLINCGYDFFREDPGWNQQMIVPYGGDVQTPNTRFFNRILSWEILETREKYRDRFSFPMPDHDVTLIANYVPTATFPLWLHVGGTVFTHGIGGKMPYDYLSDPIRRWCTGYSFGYWNRYHTITYPVGLDFYLTISSSWEWPPAYGIKIHFKKGKAKWVNYSEPYEQYKNRHTSTLITAVEIAEKGGIDNIEIINSYPSLNDPR